MFINEEGEIVDAAGLPVINLSNLRGGDQTIEMITVNGSEVFITLYLKMLRNSLGDRLMEFSMKYSDAEAFMEVSVQCDFFYRSTLRSVITALANTLKDTSVTMIGTTIITSGNHTLRVESNVLEAVQKGDEITYITEYTLSKVMKGEQVEAIPKIIEFYHDTCNTYFHENKLILDRYHYPSENERLPIDEMCHVYAGANNVLSQYCEVQAIGWQIEATGVKQDKNRLIEAITLMKFNYLNATMPK